MTSFDLNADIGEADTPEWIASETAILSAITSANIACGGHAGNIETMRNTARQATQENVAIGAHPAFPDRENFGRQSLVLGDDISATDLKESLYSQISDLVEVCASLGTQLRYVKPHGALYNDAVFDDYKAKLIAEVVAKMELGLSLLGAQNSEFGTAAKQFDLNFVAEGFIDRRYTDDGHLLSRKIEGAVLTDQKERIEQALSLTLSGQVKTQSGKMLDLTTRSLCVHGDSAGAVQTAKLARRALEEAGLKIEAFT